MNSNAASRLVLLGASNLTRAISTVVATARQCLGEPLDVYAALGHGRSYGKRSSILFGARALPGILECGLWDALNANPSARTFALITDIGNDIMYGVAPVQIANWVEQCIERLQHHQAKIAMTMLPIESIRAVKRWQYAIVKRMLFPTHELSFVDAIARANEVHDLTIDLAQRRGVMLIPTRSEWYGFDPIHIRARHWPSAWGAMIGRCCDRPNAGELQTSFNNWWRLRTHMFDRYWLLGRERRVEQPLQVSGGTAVSFF